MTTKNIALVILSLAMLGAAAYFVSLNMQPEEGVESDGDLTNWLCTAEGCGAEFTTTRRQLLEIYEASPERAVPCPKCTKVLTVQAVQCASCSRLLRTVGHAQIPDVCPHCGKSPLPPG